MDARLYKFLAIRFFSSLGDQLLLFAVPLLVYKATHNIAMSGLAFVIEWTPRVISLPFAGMLSDRLGGRSVYLMSDFVRSLICLIGFTIIVLYPSTIFYSVSTVMGICAFFYAQAFIAQEATIPTLVKFGELHKAQSVVQTVEQATLVLGPFFASVIVLVLPIEYLLLVTAVIFSFSFSGMLLLKGFSKVITQPLKKNVLQEMKLGINIILANEKLIWLCIITIVLNLIWGMMLSTGAVMVTGIFAKTNVSFGFLQTLSGILSVTILLLAPFLINRTSVVFIGLLSYLLIVLGGMLVGFSHNYWEFCIGYLLIMSMDGLFNIYIRTERSKIIPQEHLGKVIGFIVFLNQLSLPIAGLLVANFSHRIGVSNLFISVSFMATVCLFVRFKKDLNISRKRMFSRYSVRISEK